MRTKLLAIATLLALLTPLSVGAVAVSFDKGTDAGASSLTYNAASSNEILVIGVQTPTNFTPTCTVAGSGATLVNRGQLPLGGEFFNFFFKTGVASGNNTVACAGGTIDGVYTAGYLANSINTSSGISNYTSSASTFSWSTTTAAANSWSGFIGLSDSGFPNSTDSTYTSHQFGGARATNMSASDTNGVVSIGSHTFNGNSGGSGTNFIGRAFELLGDAPVVATPAMLPQIIWFDD